MDTRLMLEVGFAIGSVLAFAGMVIGFGTLLANERLQMQKLLKFEIAQLKAQYEFEIAKLKSEHMLERQGLENEIARLNREVVELRAGLIALAQGRPMNLTQHGGVNFFAQDNANVSPNSVVGDDQINNTTTTVQGK